jgi:hypothetical protein
MSAIAIIGAINALTQLTVNLTPLIQQAMAVANSDDAAAINAATAELTLANDAMFPATMEKLDAAEQAG